MKNLCFIGSFLLFGLDAFSYSFYEGTDQEAVAEFRNYIVEIAGLKTGQSLLDQLEAKMRANKLKIVRGDHLLFSKDTLFLGPVSGRVGCPCRVEAMEHPVWTVGSIEEPYYIAVAHELIHCLHRCESKEKYLRQLQQDACHWQDFFQVCDQEKCKDIRRYKRLCFSAEEERTILGGFDVDGQRNLISEAQLMVEAGLYPRYVYQDHDRHFYECYTILNAILKTFESSSSQEEFWSCHRAATLCTPKRANEEPLSVQ